MRRLSVAALIATALVATPTPAFAVDPPPQEPGVTLRTYDIGVPLSKVCELKPGQTPNVDKLMPTIDWSTDATSGSRPTSSRTRSRT